MRSGFRDDCEDFDDFVLDVIEHLDVAHSETKLRLSEATQPLDTALAHLPGLVPQVRFQGVPNLRAQPCRQSPQFPDCLWSQDDLEALVPSQAHRQLRAIFEKEGYREEAVARIAHVGDILCQLSAKREEIVGDDYGTR